MTSLQWHPVSGKNAQSVTPRDLSCITNRPIWFVVALGLMGVIVGFVLGKWQQTRFPIASLPSAAAHTIALG